MPRRVEIGVVTSAKTPKTRRVEVARLVRHPQYGKYVRRRTVCYVHDEHNESGLGDTVQIEESRPLSRTKRWRLVRVVVRSQAVDVAALRAGARGQPRSEDRLEADVGVAPPAGPSAEPTTPATSAAPMTPETQSPPVANSESPPESS